MVAIWTNQMLNGGQPLINGSGAQARDFCYVGDIARANLLALDRGGGAIINQSSTAAWMSTGFYGVAKLAVNGITQSLANELGWRKIRVNAIAPGPTDTGALAKTAGDYAKEMIKSMPIKRLGTPKDMADAALFLLSDEASWITGQCIGVDGGLTQLA